MIFYQRTVSFFFFGLIFVEQKGTLVFPFKVSLPLSMCSDFFLFIISRENAVYCHYKNECMVCFSL